MVNYQILNLAALNILRNEYNEISMIPNIANKAVEYIEQRGWQYDRLLKKYVKNANERCSCD